MPSPEELETFDPPRWSQQKGQPVVVAGRAYRIPQGWKLAHVQGAKIAYLLGRDGLVYCLSARGEHRVPGRVQSAIRKRYFGTAPPSTPDRVTALVEATLRLTDRAGR